MMRDRTRACLFVPVLTVALATAGLAEDGDAPASTVTEAIGVEVINVDVVVTDKKGRPVVGLERDDFELRIDGRPVAISNFYEVRRETERRAAARASRPRLTVESPVGVDPEALRSALEIPHLVVVIDYNHLSPAGRRRMLAQLPAFIEQQIVSGTRVMTVVNEGSPRVLRGFDAGAAEHVEALGGLGKGSIEGLERQRSWRDFVENVIDVYETCVVGNVIVGDQSPCIVCAPDFINLSRVYAQRLEHHRRRSIAGLESMISVLRGVPGRKVMLYVSDGLPREPGVESLYYLQDLCPENASLFQQTVHDRPSVGPLQPLVAHANANRVTIYSLEAAGLEALSSASVEYAGPSSASRPTGPNIHQRNAPSSVNDQIRVANRQSGLFYLAAETGGRAILNLNDVTPELARLGEELGHYYSLGYVLESDPGDRIRRIGVRMPKGSTTMVQHRRSFRYRPQEEQVAERTFAAQLIGVESNELDARVVIGIPVAGGEDLYRVPIDIFIPLDRLALEPGESLDQGRVAVLLAAPDRKATRTRIRKQEVGVVLPDGAGGFCRLGVEVELAAGEHLLGLGLWDRAGGGRSFLRLPVEVDPAKSLPAGVTTVE